MKLDPELDRSLDRVPNRGADARLHDLGIIHLLRDTLAMHEIMGISLPVDTRVTTDNRTFLGADGTELTARVYRSAIADAGAAEAGLVFFHGGGYLLGDVYTEEDRCLALCAPGGITIASLSYRLAPDAPHPAPSEDGYAGLCWVAENASELGIDTARLAVGGSSAGGGLAASVALMARDRGGPPLAFQLLVYPMLDDRLETPSMNASSDDHPLFTRAAAADAWGYFLDGHPADAYAAPARADDLAGLPPAYVSVAEHDPLRDEGVDYARRLVQAGVPTELHLYPGTFHGFDIVGSRTAMGRRALGEQRAALEAALLSPGGPVR